MPKTIYYIYFYHSIECLVICGASIDMALVYEGERLLALTWCCFVFLCVEVVGANNGVEPLDDEDKKQ